MATDGGRKVTVALPVYNGERYLAEALASVAAQTRAPDEVLLFDNCSTDSTREIAAAQPGLDGVRAAESNQGAVQNFNRAVRESTGDYFAWLAADDRMGPRFVELASAVLDAEPDRPICLTGIRFIDPDGRTIGEEHDPELTSTDARVRLRAYLRQPHWTEVYALYRRDRLLASPIFRDEYGADVLLTWWFLLRGPIAVIEDLQWEYRRYPRKSLKETVQGLNPDMPSQQWRSVRMWHTMWRDTAAPDVDRSTRRQARRELLTCLLHRAWIKHVVWDAYIAVRHLARRPEL
jgi:glycosyltransferase involved in cell wall biosynthesis